MATMALNLADCGCDMKKCTKEIVTDLHCLAFLLTGRSETSADLVIETISSEAVDSSYSPAWMVAWCRKSIIRRALAIVCDSLAASARQTRLSLVESSELPARGWSLDHETKESELQRALLGIDVFPRAAILLSIFEGVPIRDVANLLGADPDLVRKGQMIGLRELTANLARIQGWTPAGLSTDPCVASFASRSAA